MNILLLADQLRGFAMGSIGKRLQERGHSVLLADCHWYNFLNSSAVYDHFDDIGFDSYVNYEEKYQRLNNETDPDVDWEYLREFEKERCVNKTFHQLLLTDPILQRQHHHRSPFFTPIESKDYVYYWAQLQIEWVESLLDDFDPDVIVSLERNQFIKNVFSQISSVDDIPMLTILHSRIKDLVILSRNFGYGQDVDAEKYIKQNPDPSQLTEAREFVSEFRAAGEGASLYELSQQVADDQLHPLSDIVEDLARTTLRLTRRSVKREKEKYRGSLLSQNRFSDFTPYLFFFGFKRFYKKIWHRATDSFQQSLPRQPFVYIPLHTLPESSTLTLSTDYYEADILRYLSNEFPVGLRLAVKENPHMIATRPTDFYDEVRDLPNVDLLDPTVPSKRLIEQSRGVCSISGTALLEAVLLDTPTLAFGYPEFRDLIDFTGREGAAAFADACLEERGASHHEDAVAYVQYVFDEGREVQFDAFRYRYPDHDAFESGVDTVEEMLHEELQSGVEPVPAQR